MIPCEYNSREVYLVEQCFHILYDDKIMNGMKGFNITRKQ